MRIIDCEPAQHAEAIRAIFNHAIVHTTALYETEPRSPAVIAEWFEAKRRGDLPVIGAASDAGELMGFATFGPFRPQGAYRFTVEHTVYVAEPCRGRGIGGRLLGELIERARRHGVHTMVGVIDTQNAASLALHEKLGFTRCGVIEQVGWKFERWLDAAFYQLVL